MIIKPANHETAAINIEPRAVSLNSLFGDAERRLAVPRFQRNYCWRREQVLDFWNDLLAYTSSEQQIAEHYFFGSIVLVASNDDGKRMDEILDGQQRLVTVKCFVCIVRDLLAELEDHDRADSLHTAYITTPMRPDGSCSYRMELNFENKAFFQENVQERGQTLTLKPGKSKNQQRLKDAVIFLRDRLRQYVSGYNGQEKCDKLAWLCSVLLQKFVVIAIQTPNADYASTIFETLNERGLNLSTSDLLRNFLLEKSRKNDRNQVAAMWDELSNRAKKLEVVLRQSWTSQHGRVKAHALYRVIKDKLLDAKVKPIDYIRTLKDDAETLESLSKARFRNEPSLHQAAYVIKCARAQPVGFAALLAIKRSNNLHVEKKARLYNALAIMAMRLLLISPQKDKDKYEDGVYSCIECLIRRQPYEHVFKCLQSFTPTDQDLVALIDSSEPQPITEDAAKCLLCYVEAQWHPEAEKEPALGRKLHLEHILSKKPRTQSKERSNLLRCLGNLTLLGDKLNKSASNKTFANKKKHYAKSEMKITKDLLNFNKFAKEQVRQRERELRRAAMEYWSLASGNRRLKKHVGQEAEDESLWPTQP
jgi:hypothetical protein